MDMQRIFAHRILLEGVEYRMSVIEIGDDMRVVAVKPFVRETAATRFVSGSLTVIVDSEQRVVSLKSDSNCY